MLGLFIDVTLLNKSYKTEKNIQVVLKDVSLQMEKGSIGVILGPSGSGKSTMMNIIGGVDRADSGKVLVDGREITSLTDGELTEYRRESIGFVFQYYNWYPISPSGRTLRWYPTSASLPSILAESFPQSIYPN